MKSFLYYFLMFVIALIFASGIIVFWYVIDTKGDCWKYERENPNIEFNWSFETACEFRLSDGTWFSILDYERQEKFEIDFDD